MEKIIEIEDRAYDEIFVRYIFGLNIFRVNKVNRNKHLELEFLKFISQETLVSGHTGSLHDIADSPKDLFGLPNKFTYYEEVKVGVFGGAFYSTDVWSLFSPCFFLKVDKFFWNIRNGALNSDLEKILGWDALAVYVSPRDNSYAEAMKSLFETKFVSSDDWIKKVLSLYRLIIVSAGDMNFFAVYADSPTDFDLLSSSLKKTEEIITSNKWYQDNKSKLIWDENHRRLIL